MKVMAGISKTIDRIVKAIGMFAAYLSVLIMFLIVAEVFMRRVFASPTLWSYETVTFLFGGMIMLSLPYGLQLGVNVRVDVLYNVFNKKTKRIIDIATFIVFFGIFMLIFTTAGVRYFGRYLSSLERSWSTWAPVLWPVKATIPACGILMLLQGISELIKLFFRLFDKGDALGLSDDDDDKVAQEIEEILATEADSGLHTEAIEEIEKGGSEQ